MDDFVVLSGGTVIGHSSLETGDPPMGVASGKLKPTAAYASIQALCIASRDASQQHLSLTVIQPNGQRLPATLGVSILDYSVELGPDEIEVHALGIGYQLYEELFPDHVAFYGKQFG